MKKTLLATFALLLTLMCLFPSGISAQKTEPATSVSFPVAGNDGTIFCDGVDVIHTHLDILKIDWKSKSLRSKATITGQIAEDSARYLKLSVKGNWNITDLKFDGVDAALMQDSANIWVFFSKKMKLGQSFKVEIAYSVINQKAGLHFVNFDGKIPGQPVQLWTQGEPEDNAYWLPLHDCPDKMTTSISLTVENKYTTISNGVRLPSKKLRGGMRKDTWKLDQLAYASYLPCFVVGEYKVVKKKWGNIPVEFYVEKGYENHVEAIFPKTIELLTLYTEMFGAFPWPAYRQVIVRNFTFGAMENVTIVTFNLNFQGTGRELENSDRNLAVVGHEFFHHMFGNVVTCIDWANLTLNEGWATYFEYVTLKHFKGKETADAWFMNYRNRYFDQCYNKDHPDAHPLIDTARAERKIMDMFDNHTYRKGGMIIRQLRWMLGDSTFNACTQSYVATNYGGYTQWGDMETAFSTASGQDLRWYFQQWGFMTGHPIIEVDWKVMGSDLVLGLRQIQREKYGWQEFIADVPVVIKYEDNSIGETVVRMDSAKFQLFVIPLKGNPKMILVDPNRVVLADWKWNMSSKEHRTVLFQAEEFFPARTDALDSLIAHREEIPSWNSLCLQMMQEDEPYIRAKAAEFANNTDSITLKQLARVAKTDESYLVRKTALSRLEGKRWAGLFKDLCQDSSIEVEALALRKLLTADTSAAIGIATKLWSQSASQRPVIFERYLTTALLDVLINVPSVKFDLCLASVCQNSGPYVWQELEGTAEKPGVMLRWLIKQNSLERGKFLTYLAEFEGRFKFTTEFFGPKTVIMGTGK